MAKIEVIKQHDLKDCGACSLLCIIKYYNGYVPLEKIREDTLTNLNGTTAYHIIKAAESYGFESMGVKIESIHNENIYLPAIVHLNLENGLQHFAVLYKISKNSVWLMDPAKGKVKLNFQEFTKIWDNIIILLNPLTKTIIRYDKDTTITSIVTNLLKQNQKNFIIIILVSIFLIALSIIGNFYFQVALNLITTSNETNFLKFIIILFFTLTIFKVLLGFLKNYYLNFLNKNIDVTIFTDFLNHIFNLPLKFIQNRTTGEITTRVSELNEIKNLLTEIFTNVILNSILIIGTIVVLYMLNTKLFLILCLVICIYLIVGYLSSKIIYYKIKKTLETTTDFNTDLVENIEMNTSIKNLNLTTAFIHKQENKLILMLKSNFELQNFLNYLELLKSIIYEIGLFSLATYGIYLVGIGELKLLSLVTFNSIILYLFEPIRDIINLIPKYNYLKVSFSKLSEFINLKSEENNAGLNEITKSDIEFKNLSYSYNKYSNIITNLNFKIHSGEKILLSGPSGSGKSSICKLLFRVLDEYDGVITINNASEQDYQLKTIRSNILYVGQNEKLFTGTIRENITCFREINDNDFQKVVKICKIDEIASKRPHRYNSLINASQNNLSGGEKQRIILARALLKKSKIIIIDEALSEVNLKMEEEILQNIFNNFPKETLLYVSHKDVQNKFQKIITLGENHE